MMHAAMSNTRILFTVSTLFGLLGVSCAQMCPDEWTSYEGSCYSMGTELLSWADAEEVCRLFESDLAVIETQAENDFVKRMLSEHHSSAKVWIGATDIFNEGQFMWLRTFENVEFTDWMAGEPNHWRGNNSEDCVDLIGSHNWQWNDESCTQTLYFLCEMSIGSSGVIG